MMTYEEWLKAIEKTLNETANTRLNDLEDELDLYALWEEGEEPGAVAATILRDNGWED
jgi:hypothetical protein